MIADLRVAARLVKAKHPGLPLFLLGESMGGSVIMAAMTGDDPPVADGVILAAPAIWGFQTLPPMARKAIEVAAHVIPWMKVVPTGVHVQASDNRAALRDLARDPLVIKETRDRHGLWPGPADEHRIRRGGEAGPAALAGDVRRARGDPRRGAVNEALPHFPRSRRRTRARLAIYRRGYHLLLRDFDQYAVLTTWRPGSAIPRRRCRAAPTRRREETIN